MTGHLLKARMVPLALLMVSFFIKVADSKLDFDTTASIDNIDNLVQYEYQYQVDEGRRSGPVMDRWERRLGEYVKGAYSVLQPDGSVRTVDYEVDGKSGYHAVTRLSPPSSEYLSYQQLSQSHDIFPDAALTPLLPDANKKPKPDPANPAEIVNYHAKPPYVNKRGESLAEYKDHKAAASTNLAVAALNTKKPLTPANYNVPQTQELIYFKKPAGKIQPDIKLPQNIFDIDAKLHSNKNKVDFTYTDGITAIKTKELSSRRNRIHEPPTKPVKKYSRLVKRYNSFDEVFY